MKESDPNGTSKTLMPPTWVQKLNGGENPKGNLEKDQVARLQG